MQTCSQQEMPMGRPIQVLSSLVLDGSGVLLRNPYKSLPSIAVKFSFGKDVCLRSYVFQSLQQH